MFRRATTNPKPKHGHASAAGVGNGNGVMQLRSLSTRIAFNLETNVATLGTAQAQLEVKRSERASIAAKLTIHPTPNR
jgi:hypothetical protein